MSKKKRDDDDGPSDRQPFAELPAALDVRKLGRPSDYDPEFCDFVLDMGRAGKSKAQMAAGLGISRQTLWKWSETHPEFADALKEASDLALAWWETAGQINMTRQGFNATAYIFQMKNRFRDDYADVQHHRHGGADGGAIEVNVNKIDQARRVAFALGRALAQKAREDATEAEQE